MPKAAINYAEITYNHNHCHGLNNWYSLGSTTCLLLENRKDGIYFSFSETVRVVNYTGLFMWPVWHNKC